MKSNAKLIVVGVSTAIAFLTLVGCDADTAIGIVDGGRTGSGGSSGSGGATGSGGSNGSGGTTGKPDTNAPQCPAGPQSPLGQPCTTPSLRCEYGYDVPFCGGRTVICQGGRWVEESHQDPQTACFDGGTDADARSDTQVEASHDTTPATCCPRDPVISACMHLGGTKTDANSCAQICDFRGATNWRVEKNAENCEVWRFDIRPPAPGDAGADSKDADPN